MKRTSLFIFCILFSVCCYGQSGKVNFTAQFKKDNDGKYKVDVDPVKELLLIMMSITDYGLGNDDMFNQKGKYYQDVLEHFKPFKAEPIIKTMDSLLKSSPLNYIFLSGNAQTYYFVGDTLQQSDVYILPADEVSDVKIKINPITRYLADIQAFIRKSRYMEFRKVEQPFYNSIVSDYENSANLGKQWAWLEKNFETKINSYKVYTSPLINGLNYTGGYTNNNFRLIEMVLPTLTKNGKRSKKSEEAFNTRVMFTEIDHNYVGPPSDKYKTQINAALKDRQNWINTKTYGTQYYTDGTQVFNEYITYGIFVLYAEDLYKNDPVLLKEINAEIVAVMNDRGFTKMKAFTDQLRTLHLKNRKTKIDKLYPKLISWCMSQS